MSTLVHVVGQDQIQHGGQIWHWGQIPGQIMKTPGNVFISHYNDKCIWYIVGICQ